MTASSTTSKSSQRVLIVDDLERIHEDYRRILGGEDETLASGRRLLADVSALLGDESDPEVVSAKSAANARIEPEFRLDSAYQGQEALELVRAAKAAGDPFKVAFIDMRMPPGWDGLFTIERIREVDTEIQIVICSAYSDYSWREIQERVGRSEDLLVLKKPFDSIEVHQMASALAEKWDRKHSEAQIRGKLLAQAQVSQAAAANLAGQQKQRDAKLAEMLNTLSRSADVSAERDSVAVPQGRHFLSNRLADLADYLALTSGNLQLHREVVDVTALLNDCALAARPFFAAAYREIAVSIGVGTPRRIWADGARLRRVVSALMEDIALRSTDELVRLSVEVVHSGSSRCTLRFASSVDSQPVLEADPNGLGVPELLTLAMGGVCETNEVGSQAVIDFDVIEASESRRAS